MVVVKVTSKGQLTLPVEIRRKLNIKPGDEVTVEILDEDSAQLKITKPPSLPSLYGALPTDKTPHDKKDIRRQVGEHLGQQMDDQT